MKMLLPKRVNLWLQSKEALRPLLPPAAKLLVAVSGGPDSLALLHVLKAIFPSERLVAAYLDHGWREEAVAEAQFVRETAVSWNIPCHAEKVDTIALARDEGLSLEEAGRKARFGFLARLANKIGAKAIALGHHADDQAETVLMRLLRGSGLAGLRGMLPVSPLPGAPDLWALRPFLSVTRAEIEQYCREHNLQPIADATNQDTTFLRNRLRHELLPALAEYNPQIKQRLWRMADVIAHDYELLAALTAEKWADIAIERGPGWVVLDRAGWAALPLSLRRSALRRAVERLRDELRDVGFQSIELARRVAEKGTVGGQATLPGGLILTVGYDHLTIAADPNKLPVRLPQLVGDTAVPLPIPGVVQLAEGWIIEATPIADADWTQIKRNPDPWTAFVDAAGAELVVRGRLVGERIRPLGMSGRSTKIKDVMVNRKIPSRLRENWPIVATAFHPVWLVGHVLDERGRVTAVSQTIICLRCQKIG
ncbi:MAG: tRNA lysidine(34) synthetase TilS [Chloroflexi bacterium]|nr:tRNA lysidine(34) synthetase TilS [Chloroflexota bacterium]